MTRLNSYHRDAIIRRAIDDTVVKRHAFLQEEGYAIARQIFEAITTKDERDAIAKLIGKGWFNTGGLASINAGGYHVYFSIPKDIPSSISRIDVPEHLVGIVQDHLQRMEKAKNDARQAHIKLASMLSTITTFEKLKAAWPEGEAYWKPVWESAAATSSVPAIQVSEINKALGLPKEAA